MIRCDVGRHKSQGAFTLGNTDGTEETEETDGFQPIRAVKQQY